MTIVFNTNNGGAVRALFFSADLANFICKAEIFFPKGWSGKKELPVGKIKDPVCIILRKTYKCAEDDDEEESKEDNGQQTGAEWVSVNKILAARISGNASSF